MTAMVMSLARMPISIFPAYRGKAWWACLSVGILLMVIFSSALAYASGWGGYISEKLIGRSGVNNSSLLVGRSGVSNSALDVAMSGVATATGATNIYMDGAGTHATLNGNLQSLRGFPSVSVYFQWGYDGVYDHSTAAQTMAATGSFSDTIAHFDPSKAVNYRAVVVADGTNYSSPSTFIASGGIVTGFNLLNATVVLVYVAMVIFVALAIGSRSTIAALVFLAIAIYMGEAFVTGIQEAINALF